MLDSVIFILTISRTLIIYRRHRQGSAIPLIKIMMRDGNNFYHLVAYSFVHLSPRYHLFPRHLRCQRCYCIFISCESFLIIRILRFLMTLF